jgi:hypothetical protein
MLLHTPVSEIVALATSEDVRARGTIKLEHSATAGGATKPSAQAATATAAVAEDDPVGGGFGQSDRDRNHLALFYEGLASGTGQSSCEYHFLVRYPCRFENWSRSRDVIPLPRRTNPRMQRMLRGKRPSVLISLQSGLPQRAEGF